jgi:hypothetical protein
MFNNRGQVAGDEHFVVALPIANPACIPQPHCQKPVWLSGGHDDDAVRALNAFHRHFYGFGEVLSDCVVAFDQINNRFGVGLRLKHRALSQQFIAQAEVILHNPIVHNHNFAVPAQVGMGVLLVRGAVRCPAGMPDANIALHRLLSDERFETGYFACVPPHYNFFILQHRNTGGIISAVFKLF